MSTSTSPSSPTPKPISKADGHRLAWGRGVAPPPHISVPEWCDRYRRLAKESGSNSGKWNTATVEIARGPMLAVTEPGVHTITAMTCTQLLKTSLLENVFGFHAHLDPCPILLVQPKDDAAEQFSKERITPLIKATPVLRDLVGTGKTRSADETLTYKRYPGGFLALVGAGSPDNLARRPVRITLFDEVDKYPSTREGDPIALGEERLATFVNWISIRACSPTIESESKIAASYEESDQRRASVECPHCRHRQFLEFFKHVEWDKVGEEHRPKTARIYCEKCGVGWSEGDRLRALQTIRWHQTRPFTCCDQKRSPLEDYAKAWRDGAEDAVERIWDWWAGSRWAVYRAKCPECRKWGVDNEHAGFQTSKLYSPWAKDKPSDIAAKWLVSQEDEEKKQAWWNTQLGLPYRARIGKEIRPDVLMERREPWAGDVPFGVSVLTAGIDMQDDRCEIEIVGWGRDEESWSVAYEVLEGDPESPEFWARLDELLKRRLLRQDGRPFAIEASCIDSGGHHTQQVYEFAKARLGRRIWAIKGESAKDGKRSPVWPNKRPTRKTKASYRPVIIGTNAAKDSIAARLLIDEHGPGFMHFPDDRDANYFAQLTAERLVLKIGRGTRYRVWELPPGRHNEALDCRVYAYAGLCSLLHIGLKLNARSDVLNAEPPPEPSETTNAETVRVKPEPAAKPKPRNRRPSIISSYV